MQELLARVVGLLSLAIGLAVGLTRARPPAENSGWHQAEANHRRAERRYWRSTLLLTWLLAIGAGLSAFYAYKAADISRRNFVATTRAWVDILQPFKQLSLQWKEEYVLISVDVAGINKGSSPALEASPSVLVDIYGDEIVDSLSILSTVLKARLRQVQQSFPAIRERL